MRAWIKKKLNPEITPEQLQLALAWKVGLLQRVLRAASLSFGRCLLQRGVYTRVFYDTRTDN
jgi:hypothetical protein